MRSIFLAISAIITAILVVPTDTNGGIVGFVAQFGPERDESEVIIVEDSNPGFSRGETVLEKASNGHYFANARVDGVDIPMLVDTGASFVALTARDAEALGLYWDEDEAIVVAQGASGAVKGIPVRLDTVEVGDHMVRNVRAAVIPKGLGVSLLGQSFLSGVDRVEIADGRMILSGD